MKAIWGSDYDFRTDKIYRHPVCPNCKEPIGKFEDGKYHCFNCGEVVEVDDLEMIGWFNLREDIKIEYEDCPKITTKDGKHSTGCGGIGTVQTHFMRNPVTLEWQRMGGLCTKCGFRYIV